MQGGERYWRTGRGLDRSGGGTAAFASTTFGTVGCAGPREVNTTGACTRRSKVLNGAEGLGASAHPQRHDVALHPDERCRTRTRTPVMHSY